VAAVVPELNAMLATYWPSVGSDDVGTARMEMIERVRNFVAEVEENI
jgi:hypothetical protein